MPLSKAEGSPHEKISPPSMKVVTFKSAWHELDSQPNPQYSTLVLL
jgi:hypothetical protein